MTLELSGDVKIQLEEQGLLVRIISQLNHLPMDVVQNLSEVCIIISCNWRVNSSEILYRKSGNFRC